MFILFTAIDATQNSWMRTFGISIILRIVIIMSEEKLFYQYHNKHSFRHTKELKFNHQLKIADLMDKFY